MTRCPHHLYTLKILFDLPRLEYRFDFINEFWKFLSKLRIPIRLLDKVYQFLANKISQGLLDAVSLLNTLGRLTLLNPDFVKMSHLKSPILKNVQVHTTLRIDSHDLRHTFATRLVQSGIDLYTVAKLLGHKDIRMTQRYAHHCPESLRHGVDIWDRSGAILVTFREKQVTSNSVTN